MATLMQQRRGTAAEWDAVNPIMAEGEIGIETDTGVMKVGDGVTRWKSIQAPYLPVSGGRVKAGAPANIALTLQSAADQTADILRVVDVSGNILGGINAAGKFYQTGLARFTAKGDLLVGTGADAASKLPLGTVGLVLTSDPTTPTGVKWGPVSKATDVQVFTASGTWTKPANARAILAIVIGGGSSGQATSSTAQYQTAPGGAGGVRVAAELLPAALADTVSVTVGAGGPRGSLAPTNANPQSYGPVAGGESIFGPIRAKGGGMPGAVGNSLGGSGPTPGNNIPDAIALSPGGGNGSSQGYGAGRVDGSSPVGTIGQSRSGSGLGGDGGYGATGYGADGGLPGAGGGGSTARGTTDGNSNWIPGSGNASAGAGGRGEVIVITFF